MAKQPDPETWRIVGQTGQAVQLADPAAPHLHIVNREEQWGSEADRPTQGSSAGK